MPVRLDQIPEFFANLLVGLKLTEHPDGFNTRNIPSYLLDQMFHVELGTINGSAANQITHSFSVPVTINVYYQDYRSPNDLRLVAFKKAHEILQLVLNLKVRTSNGIKDIRPQSITLVPIPSNDGAAILTLSFEVLLTYVFQGDF